MLPTILQYHTFFFNIHSIVRLPLYDTKKHYRLTPYQKMRQQLRNLQFDLLEDFGTLALSLNKPRMYIACFPTTVLTR